jgi:phenylacetate-CoA ligase
MLIVRGVNVFPSAIEGIVRRHPAIEEFRIEVFREAELDEIRLLVEARQPSAAPLVREALRCDLGIRVDVVPVPLGSLPRWELKAKRVVRLADAR